MPGPNERAPWQAALEQLLTAPANFGRGLFYDPSEPIPEEEGAPYAAGAAVSAGLPFLGATRMLRGGARGGNAAMRGLQGAMGAEGAAAPAQSRAPGMQLVPISRNWSGFDPVAAPTQSRAPIMQLLQERPVMQMDPSTADVEGLIGQLNQGLGRAQGQSMVRQMRTPHTWGAQGRTESLSPGATDMATRMFNESRALGARQPAYNETARMLPSLPPGVNPIGLADLQPRSMEEAAALAAEEVARFGRPRR